MTSNFFKFPATPHLTVLPDVEIRGDKVFSKAEQDDFLQHELTVEEKVDGANLGISFDSECTIQVQNRGAYLPLPATGQWKKLEQWLAGKTEVFFDVLVDRYILFGEWCYAQHSVFYNKLPDWFLGFDLYDKQVGRFLCVKQRNELFKKLNIYPVPVIAQGCFSYYELKQLLAISLLGEQAAEGLYLRFDTEYWLGQRAKLVRTAFIQSVEQHWSREAINPNQLTAASYS